MAHNATFFAPFLNPFLNASVCNSRPTFQSHCQGIIVTGSLGPVWGHLGQRRQDKTPSDCPSRGLRALLQAGARLKKFPELPRAGAGAPREAKKGFQRPSRPPLRLPGDFFRRGSLPEEVPGAVSGHALGHFEVFLACLHIISGLAGLF